MLPPSQVVNRKQNLLQGHHLIGLACGASQHRDHVVTLLAVCLSSGNSSSLVPERWVPTQEGKDSLHYAFGHTVQQRIDGEVWSQPGWASGAMASIHLSCGGSANTSARSGSQLWEEASSVRQIAIFLYVANSGVF